MDEGTNAYKRTKRVLDVTIAGIGLLVGSLPMLFIGLLVKLSSAGPILYKGDRMGRDRRVFQQMKFRTMILDAPDLRNSDGSTLSTGDDPRVTTIGKFLRRTSLDELPQLINILRGEMSLIGPRPDPPSLLELYRPQDFDRLSVLPGLTGWAQIHGRNSVPVKQRRELDLEYVRSRGVLLDLKILVLTIPYVLAGRGVLTPSESEGRSAK